MSQMVMLPAKIFWPGSVESSHGPGVAREQSSLSRSTSTGSRLGADASDVLIWPFLEIES
jgi:hypothetical protein